MAAGRQGLSLSEQAERVMTTGGRGRRWRSWRVVSSRSSGGDALLTNRRVTAAQARWNTRSYL